MLVIRGQRRLVKFQCTNKVIVHETKPVFLASFDVDMSSSYFRRPLNTVDCFCFFFSGCPSTASVCMIRKGSNKVNVVGVTSTQRMSVNGEFGICMHI